jgi:hypothetical protein
MIGTRERRQSRRQMIRPAPAPPRWSRRRPGTGHPSSGPPRPGGLRLATLRGRVDQRTLALSPRSDLLVEYQPEFEELTGITVTSDVVPEQQQRQKQIIEFTSGNPSFDVTAVSWHVQKGLFGPAASCSTSASSSMTRR